MEKSLPKTAGKQLLKPPQLNIFEEILVKRTKEVSHESSHPRIAGYDLFSMFTANIIKARKTFTR